MLSFVASAKEYTARSETMGMDRAFVINLIRAADVPIFDCRLPILDFLSGEVDKFRRGNVKPVAVGVEIAAVAAGITGILDFRSWILDLLFDPAV